MEDVIDNGVTRRKHSVLPAILGIVVYLCLLLLPVGLALITSKWSSPSVMAEAAKMMALTGMSAMMLQFILGGRLRFLTLPYGLDMVLGFHRLMGPVAVLLILGHPLLLAWDGNVFAYFFVKLDVPWYFLMGRAALLLAAIHGTFSLLRVALNADYQKWLFVHRLAAPLIITGGFAHSLAIGSDLKVLTTQVAWSGLFGLAALSFLNSRVIRPTRSSRGSYSVTSVKQESDNVTTLTLVPPAGASRIDHLPGQFHFLTLLRGRGLPREEHPFTIASSPTADGYLQSTIKNSGDFTATVRQTREGDKAAVLGPYGRFSYVLHPNENDLVFIAGGIGITPLMSMLRHMHDTDTMKNVTLLYANRTEKDIVFRREIEQIKDSRTPCLTVAYFLQNPPSGWEGESGYVTREALEKYCADTPSNIFYVCGPPVMMKKIAAALKAMGVKNDAIRMERFSF